MKDLRHALEQRSKRGDPIGSDRLRQRVAFDLAGGHMRPENPTRKYANLIFVGAAALVALLAFGAIALLTGDDPLEPAPAATEATTPPTTLATDDTVAFVRIPTDPLFDAALTEGAFVDSKGVTVYGCYFDGMAEGPPFDTPILRAAMWFSHDGRVWESLLDAPNLDDAGCIGTLIETTHGYVALGESAVWLSDDGRAWQRVDPPSMNDMPTWSAGIVEGPGGLLVAGSVDGEVRAWSSTDGTEWSLVSNALLPVTGAVQAWHSNELGYFIGGEIFMADLVNEPGLWHSANLVDWTQVEPDTFWSDATGVLPTAIDAFTSLPDGSVVAMDSIGGLWQSEDGVTWNGYDGDADFRTYERTADGRIVDWDDEFMRVSADDGSTWDWYSTTGMDSELHGQLAFVMGGEVIVFADYEYPDDDEGRPPPPLEVWVATIPG